MRFKIHATQVRQRKRIPLRTALRAAVSYKYAKDNWRVKSSGDLATLQQAISSANANLAIVAALFVGICLPMLLSEDIFSPFNIDSNDGPQNVDNGLQADIGLDASQPGRRLASRSVSDALPTSGKPNLGGACAVGALLFTSVCSLTVVCLVSIRNVNFVELVHLEACARALAVLPAS